MKRILFVIDSLRVGGIQTALINLLKKIDYDKYQIDLALFHYQDSYKKNIPAQVNIISMPFLLNTMNYSGDEVKSASIVCWIVKKTMALLCRILGSNFVYSRVLKKVPKLETQYDWAFSFTNNVNNKSTYFGVNKFVLENVKANRKATWLHVDYDAMNMNNELNNNEYRQFDEIIHVSEAVRNSFLRYLPELESRSSVIYNIIDENTVVEKSRRYEVPEKDGFKLITVARLDQNKNVAEGLRIAQRLKNDGLQFTWLIIGDGPARNELEEFSRQHGLADCIEFLGYLDNPFPYVKNSNLYVSNSLSESFGLSIIEANTLGIPAVVRKYPAASEIIEDGKNGFIAENEEEMYLIIKELIMDKQKYLAMHNTCNPQIDDGVTMSIFERFIDNAKG